MALRSSRHAWLAMALLAAATQVAAQDTAMASLKPGVRVRVWYAPHGLAGAVGVLSARRADTIRFRRPSEQQRLAHVDDYHIPVAGLERIEVGAGRDPKKGVGGGAIGFAIGAAIGAGLMAVSFNIGKPDPKIGPAPRTKLQWSDLRWPALVFGAVGATVGSIRALNGSERWQPIRVN